MTNEEIIAGNKLIAVFMGQKIATKFRHVETGRLVNYSRQLEKDYFINEDEPITCYIGANGTIYPELKYHSSYDWLTPVVEKIAKLPNHLYPDGLFSKLVKVNINVSDKVITIADVYKANNPFSANDNYVTNDGDKWCPFIEKYDEIFINAVWLACLEFIKWYNTQKTL